MEDEEVADIDIFSCRLGIVAVNLDLIDVSRRKQGEQAGNTGLDEMDAGRFERLEKAARKAQRDDILHPSLFAVPGCEAKLLRFSERRAIEIAKQGRRRLILATTLGGCSISLSLIVEPREA